MLKKSMIVASALIALVAVSACGKKVKPTTVAKPTVTVDQNRVAFINAILANVQKLVDEGPNAEIVPTTDNNSNALIWALELNTIFNETYWTDRVMANPLVINENLRRTVNGKRVIDTLTNDALLYLEASLEEASHYVF